MSKGSNEANGIKEKGWRQSSSLPPSLFGLIARETNLDFIPGQHLALVVSQDCDVVCRTYLTEPTVEIIRATVRPKLDGNLAYAKSSRKLQLELVVPNGTQVYELSIHERRLINRRLLMEAGPDKSVEVSDVQKRQLAGWLAKRYRRDAFPDAFIERLQEKKPATELRELFKEWGRWLSGVFVLLDTDDDLPQGQQYGATVWATVPKEYFDDEHILLDLNEIFHPSLAKALESFGGLDVHDTMVVSEEHFTLNDIRHTRKLDLDDLSYREDGPETESE